VYFFQLSELRAEIILKIQLFAGTVNKSDLIQVEKSLTYHPQEVTI